MVTLNVEPEATQTAVRVAVELHAHRPRSDTLPGRRAARLPPSDPQPVPTRLVVADGQVKHVEPDVDAAERSGDDAAARQVGWIVVREVGRRDVRVRRHVAG